MAKTVARKKSAARHGYHHKIVGASFEEAEFQGPRTWFIASALLALIGIWGLLAWLLGLPLGGEIRSDPFGLDAKASMPSRLVDGFLSTIPHPALGRMEVVPSGLSGVLTPRDFEPVATEGAAAPSPSLSDFVNSPQTAMEKILANRNTGPAAASRDGSPPRHFVFAGEAPSSKQSGPSSKSPPSQKGGPSPDQSTVSGKTDGEPSPVESSEPQPAIEQKTIEPSPVEQKTIEPNPVEQNTVKPNPAGEPKPTEPSPPTREEPVLLAGLVLIGKDGKDHLVAIDTAQHLLGFDETKGSWRPISRNSDFLGIDNSLVVSPIREAGFGVGYYLSDSWIVFRSGEEPNVFPFMNLSEHAQIHYPVWTGDGFLANQTGAQGFDGIEIIQQDKPNFGLTQIFVPPSKAQPSFYSVTLAPQEAGHWAIWSGGDKGLLKMRDDGEIVLREVQISAPIRSIFFETPTQGWASSGWEGADRPVVLETSDGGQTWQVIPYRWLPALGLPLFRCSGRRLLAWHGRLCRALAGDDQAEHRRARRERQSDRS
jgi:hypothetical protein